MAATSGLDAEDSSPARSRRRYERPSRVMFTMGSAPNTNISGGVGIGFDKALG